MKLTTLLMSNFSSLLPREKEAEMVKFAVVSHIGFPLLVGPTVRNSLITRRVQISDPSIGPILSMRSPPQIAEPVMGSVQVTVVNLIGGPSTRHIEPCKLMCLV